MELTVKIRSELINSQAKGFRSHIDAEQVVWAEIKIRDMYAGERRFSVFRESYTYNEVLLRNPEVRVSVDDSDSSVAKYYIESPNGLVTKISAKKQADAAR